MDLIRASLSALHAFRYIFYLEAYQLGKILFVLLFVIFYSGCSTDTVKIDAMGRIERYSAPQLWSDHKLLDLSIDICALKAKSALSALGFTGVVQNGNFSYGNFNNNRAAVKCVEISGGSFVYFSVAGPDKNIVEKLRNEIAWQF